jgi:microcystin-dependent protein
MSDKLLPPDLRDQISDQARRLAELERRSTAAVVGETEPVGTIKFGIFATIPNGYLPCDGSSTDGYPALQSALAAGGWTSTVTPDLRGRFVLGADGTYALASTGGAATHTLTASEMPTHNHLGSSLQSFITDGGTDADVTRGGGNFQTKVATNDAGGGTAHNNMPPYVALTAIIRAS